MDFLEVILPPSEEELELVLYEPHKNLLSYIKKGPVQTKDDYVLHSYSSLKGCELSRQMISDLAELLKSIKNEKATAAAKEYKTLEELLITSKNEIIEALRKKRVLKLVERVDPQNINVEVAEKYFAGTARMVLYEISLSENCPENIRQALSIISKKPYEGMSNEDLTLIDPEINTNLAKTALAQISAKKRAISNYVQTYEELKKETADINN